MTWHQRNCITFFNFQFSIISQNLVPTWEELANVLEYDPSVSIAKVDCTQHRHICQDFDVKGYPTLLWIVDGKKEEKYSGARSLDAFKKFIEDKTGSKQQEAAEEEAKVEEVGVLQLTGNSFTHAIEKGVTIVKFYAPWSVFNTFPHPSDRFTKIVLIHFSFDSDSGAVTANAWHPLGTNWPPNSLAMQT